MKKQSTMTDEQVLPASPSPAMTENTESTEASPSVAHSFVGYRVIRTMSEDSASVVYKAEETRTKRTVTIGVFYSNSYATAESLKRFERDAEVLKHLNHPDLAALYDVGITKDGGYYVISEYVRGVSLNEYVRSQKPSPKERMDIFLKICDAVQYAHQYCLLHRDLTPSNIIIGGKGIVKVQGFGVALLSNRDLGQTTETKSKGEKHPELPYRSPEQIRNKPFELGVWTDVYSLGVILFELLTGRPPFETEATDLNELCRRICEERPTATVTMQSSFRGELRAIVMKALEKQPNARYGTVTAFVNDIQNFQTHMPVVASPASPLVRLRNSVIRNTFKGAVLCVIILGLTIITSKKYVDYFSNTQQFAVRAWKTADEKLKKNIADTAQAFVDSKAAKEEAEKERTLRQQIATSVGNLEAKVRRAEEGQRQAEDAIALVRAETDTTRKGIKFFADLCRRVEAARKNKTNPGILDQAYSMIKSNYGRQPALQGDLLHYTGVAFFNVGQYDKASAALSSALDALLSQRGEEHETTIETMNDLASSLYAEGKATNAEPISRKLVDLSAKVFGENDPRTITAVNNLGMSLKAQSHFKEAEPLLRRALDGRRQLYGADHPKTIVAMRNLALNMMALKQGKDAAPLLYDVVVAWKKTPPTPAWHLSIAKSELGSCLTDLGKYEEAEILLMAAYSEVKKARAGIGAEKEVMQRIVSLYQTWGQAEKETRWRAMLGPKGRTSSEEIIPEASPSAD